MVAVRVVRQQSAVDMTTPHVNTAGAVATSAAVDGDLGAAKSSYGYGTMVNELSGAPTVVGHGGIDAVFTSKPIGSLLVLSSLGGGEN